MKFKTDEISVDAGVIAIFDKDYLLSKGGSFKYDHDLHEEISGPAGEYEVKYEFESWRGTVKGSCKIKSNQTIAISDPCYWFEGNDWDKFIDETDYCKNNNEYIHFIDTGGDGGFELNIEINEVK